MKQFNCTFFHGNPVDKRKNFHIKANFASLIKM